MSTEEQHVALPKLYGAPAYARPAAPAPAGPRPFDPDDLPIEAFRSDDEQELVERLPARAWAPGGAVIEGAAGTDRDDARPALRPRPLNLRAIAGRFLGNG